MNDLQLTDQQRMQLLQQTVQGGASEAKWDAVVELFVSWPDSPAKEIAFEYCNELMQSWPDSIRVLNAAWRPLYSGNQLSSAAKIARSIDIIQREEKGNTELEIITRSRYISELKRLVIRKSSLYANGMQSLITSPYLGSLIFLSFESLTLTDEEFDIFCSASQFHSLTWLRLKNIGLNTKRITRLVQAPLLKKISRLELTGNTLDDNSMAILAAADKWTNLRELDVSNNYVTSQGAAALRQLPTLKHVKIIT